MGDRSTFVASLDHSVCQLLTLAALFAPVHVRQKRNLKTRMEFLSTVGWRS